MATRNNALVAAFGVAVVAFGVTVGGLSLLGSAGQVLGKQSELPMAAAEEEDDDLLPAPKLGADGMWVEAWEHPTTGDLARDAQLATAEGKLLVVIWEREGCPYCLQLHTHDYRMPALHEYMANKFYVVRVDFYGAHPIKDFDGTATNEHDLAARHRAVGTPTLEFRTGDGKEVLRIPGYVEPDIMLGAFRFADTGAYATTNINTWLKEQNLL